MTIKVAPEVRSSVYTGTNGDLSVALVEYSSPTFKQGDVIVLANLPAGAELLEFMVCSDSIPAGVSARLGVLYADNKIDFFSASIAIESSVNEKVTLTQPFVVKADGQLVAKVISTSTTGPSTGGPPALTSFTVDLSDNDIQVGQMATAAAIDPMPTGAQLSSVTWKSSDDTKATVQTNGNVKGVAAGTVTITGTDTATNVTATAQITISAAPVTTTSITVADSDVKNAVTFSGDDGSGTATINASAINNVTLSLLGTTTGLSNGDNVTVHVVAATGYDISGHGSAFDLQVPVAGLNQPAVVTPPSTYAFAVTVGGDDSTPKIGLDHTGSRTQGAIAPDTWGSGGATMDLFSVNKSNGAFFVKADDGSQWEGASKIEIEIEGFTNKVTLSWAAAQTQYSATGQTDLYSYLVSKSGVQIGVNIVGV